MKIKTIFFVIFCSLISCKKQEINNPFVIEIDDKKVELILENEADFLTYDIPTKAELVWTNIELGDAIFIGRGIKLIQNKNSRSYIEINYTSEKSKSDTLEIKISSKDREKDSYEFIGSIKVPVKK
ncbi:hypothetical protein [Flavobacterium sp.]|uniref:hypothetical protein n=1 Tax=Flavobacterium sp. TaxID=239 RepID=UPI0025C40AC1|nr:hypothetical protein [Flavobacterium sp.]